MMAESVTMNALAARPWAPPRRNALSSRSREYLLVRYQTDPAAIAAVLPAPLQPDGTDLAQFEFMAVPDESGYGSCVQATLTVAATLGGVAVDAIVQSYLDDAPTSDDFPILPARRGHPKLMRLHGETAGVITWRGESLVAAIVSPGSPQSTKVSLGQGGARAILARPKVIMVSARRNDDIRLFVSQPADLHVASATAANAELMVSASQEVGALGLPVGRVVDGLHAIAYVRTAATRIWRSGWRPKLPAMRARAARAALEEIA
jgi:acetoacetate decarboxylase